MSLPHFYLDTQVIAREAEQVFPLDLARDDVKHARALRLQPGQHIAVLDADADYFECQVESFDDSCLRVRIASKLARAERPTVVLAQGLAKGSKIDEAFTHATELGVAEFVTVAFERSVVKLDAKKVGVRVARWEACVKSAAMQSGQTAIPVVRDVLSFDEFVSFCSDADAVLIFWEEAQGVPSLREIFEREKLDASSRIIVVVGPEGGITEEEIEALLASNPHAYLASMGPSILRTETAGVIAPALVLYEAGALGPVE